MLNKLKQWEVLKTGDSVQVIAPASAAARTKIENGLSYLKLQGLHPEFSEDLIQTDLFFSAPLSEQWKQLEAALHSDSKVIWCLRGGYGSMRLIPLLEQISPPEKPKLFIGFSDITALHLYFNQKWNWPTLHGRTISQLHPEWEMNQEQQNLLDLLFGRTQELKYENLIPMNRPAEEKGTFDSTIIGGNLRLIQSSLGTAWEIKPEGKMLFIEDVSERGYSVDRMLEQLYQTKKLDNLTALLIGDFTEGHEKDGQNLVPEALRRFAARLPYPVLSGLPCGHGKDSNSPLPFNTKSQLYTGDTPRLICRVNN